MMLPKDSRGFVTLPSSSHVIGTTGQIISRAFTAPNETTLFVPPTHVLDEARAKPTPAAPGKPTTKGRAKEAGTAKPIPTPAAPGRRQQIAPGTFVVDPTYNWLLIAVFVFTVACIIVGRIMLSLGTG
jgi:hypothetical protein